MPACQHANNWGCWHAGVHPSSTDRPAFLPPSLSGWPSTSMPACQHANNWGAGMLGCMPAVQTHQNSWPPPGVLVDDHSNGGGQKCWSVCAAWVHPSMPAFRLWHAGMLACRSMASGQRGAQRCWDVCGVCMSQRIGHRTPTQHATDQSRSPSLDGDGWPSTRMPVCQHAHASMLQPSCWHAGVHPSSTDRQVFFTG